MLCTHRACWDQPRDSLDCILPGMQSYLRLDAGDWVVFRDMGSICARGSGTNICHYVMQESCWYGIGLCCFSCSEMLIEMRVKCNYRKIEHTAVFIG